MSETTELIPVGELPVAKYVDDKNFDALAASSNYLPRLQLFTGASSQVQEEKIAQGHFGIVKSKESIIDLHKEVNCIPISYRFKAMRFGDGEVISKYNPNDTEFKRIQSEASIPGQKGCMAGVEFLLYIPQYKEYVTYFMGNVSAKREAPNLRALIGKAATIRSNLAKNKKGTWHAPVVTMCSVPLEAPSLDRLREVSEQFANPKESEIESVDAAQVSGRAQ